MNTEKLKNKTSDPIDKSKVIVGCGNFGGIGSLPKLIGKGDDENTAHQLLNRALELGIYRFDTANSYGSGRSEEILGRFIKTVKSHQKYKMRVSTKVGNPFAKLTKNNSLSSEEIELSVDRSLKRLGVDRIHLLYFHELNLDADLEEAIATVEKCIAQEKIKYFGLSNVTFAQVREILKLMESSLREKFTYIQNEFHLLHQYDREKLIPFLEQNKISYSAFSPLAGGLVTGKYKRNSLPPEGSRLSLRPEPYLRFQTEEHQKIIREHERLSLSKGRDPAEEALRFVLSTPGIESAVIGPRKLEHYETLGLKF